MTSLTLPSPSPALAAGPQTAKQGEQNPGKESASAGGFHEVMRLLAQPDAKSRLTTIAERTAPAQTTDPTSLTRETVVDPQLKNLLNRASGEDDAPGDDSNAGKRGAKKPSAGSDTPSALNLLQFSLAGGLGGLPSLAALASVGAKALGGTEAAQNVSGSAAGSMLPGAQLAAAANPGPDEEQSLAQLQVVSSRTFLGVGSKTASGGSDKTPAAEGKAPAKTQALIKGEAARLLEPVATGSSPQQSVNGRSQKDNLPAAASSGTQADDAAPLQGPSALIDPGSSMGWSGGATSYSSTLDDLPELVGAQATSFAAQAQGASTTEGALAGATVVKELEVALDPAELGSISVKLRLASGGLHVTIQVEKPETLHAIESQKEVIAGRLGIADDASVTLLLKPSDHQTAQLTQGASTHPADARFSSQQGASNQPPGQDTQRRFSGGMSESGDRTQSKFKGASNEADVSRGGGSGGLFV